MSTTLVGPEHETTSPPFPIHNKSVWHVLWKCELTFVGGLGVATADLHLVTRFQWMLSICFACGCHLECRPALFALQKTGWTLFSLFILLAAEMIRRPDDDNCDLLIRTVLRMHELNKADCDEDAKGQCVLTPDRKCLFPWTVFRFPSKQNPTKTNGSFHELSYRWAGTRENEKGQVSPTRQPGFSLRNDHLRCAELTTVNRSSFQH